MRQEDQEFKANLGYIARPCLKKRGEMRGRCLLNEKGN
jgi:hypothetical protein